MIIAPTNVTQCHIDSAFLDLKKIFLENASTLLTVIMDREYASFEKVKLITVLLVM